LAGPTRDADYRVDRADARGPVHRAGSVPAPGGAPRVGRGNGGPAL